MSDQYEWRIEMEIAYYGAKLVMLWIALWWIAGLTSIYKAISKSEKEQSK
jgi:hypothetical protein